MYLTSKVITPQIMPSSTSESNMWSKKFHMPRYILVERLVVHAHVGRMSFVT